jgi:Na+/H+-dicarboxylate symporter
MLITVWETAFPSYAVPDAIAYVQGVEFLIDRFQTVTNVCSDMFIARMIQCAIDKEANKEMTYEDEFQQ